MARVVHLTKTSSWNGWFTKWGWTIFLRIVEAMNLEEFEAICSARTPGVWTREGWHITGKLPGGRPNGEVICEAYIRVGARTSHELDEANAAFIAACSEMVPRMIKVLKLVKEHIAWADEFTYASSIIPADLRLAIAELGQP